MNAADDARAALLAGSLITASIAPLTPSALRERERPAIVVAARRQQTPLDLTVLVFRYRVDGDSITPIRPRHSHACNRHR